MQQKRLLELKDPNWKEWAFTDESCIFKWISVCWSWSLPPSIQQNHPSKSSGGTSINKTINRAELAGIAAALIIEHTHIATVLVQYGK